MILLFWASLGALLYTYLLFPLLVGLRGLLLRRPYRSAPIQPRVSLVIAARNEADGIGAKLTNLDALEYPAECLQIIVVSDGSQDATEQIVAAHRGRPVELLRRARRGKAAALNDAAEAATGEILAFSDANSRWAHDALTKLVRPFADEQVGGVAGNQVYDDRAGDAAHGERTYWGLDRLLKQAESRAGNTISATGAIYAIRRHLFRPVPGDVTDDFFTSAGVIAQGHRLVFVPDAVAYEPPAASGQLEFKRKVRVMTRGLRSVIALRDLLNPARHGFYALQLLSHKVLRRLMGVPLLLLALASAALWRRGFVYRLAAAGQAGFYACALAGLVRWPGSQQRLFAVPAFFCLATAASLLASWNVLRGRKIDRWEPTRAAPADAP